MVCGPDGVAGAGEAAGVVAGRGRLSRRGRAKEHHGEQTRGGECEWNAQGSIVAVYRTAPQPLGVIYRCLRATRTSRLGAMPFSRAAPSGSAAARRSARRARVGEAVIDGVAIRSARARRRCELRRRRSSTSSVRCGVSFLLRDDFARVLSAADDAGAAMLGDHQLAALRVSASF